MIIKQQAIVNCHRDFMFDLLTLFADALVPAHSLESSCIDVWCVTRNMLDVLESMDTVPVEFILILFRRIARNVVNDCTSHQ